MIRAGGAGRARSAWSPAAVPATSRCTAASSASACSTPPAPVRCSPRRCRTRSCAATPGRRRRRRRPAHREELHRRRAQLPDGRRAGRRRGHRGRVASSSTTTSPCRTASTPRAAAAPAPRCSSRRSPARWPRAAARWPRSPTWPARSTSGPRSFGVALTACTTPGAGHAGLRPARRRDRARRRHPRRARPRRGADAAPAAEIVDVMVETRSTTTCRRPGDARCWCCQRPGRHPADRAVRASSTRSPAARAATGSTIARSLVGNYITSLEMAGASITVLRAHAELTALWDAPVETAGAALGRLSGMDAVR